MSADLRKTLIFVAVAVVLAGSATLASFDRSRRPEAFNDQGQKFFSDFDPNTATTLQVFEIDPETVTLKPFEVTYQNNRWVIPSHFNYPADAKKRLVDTATGIEGLTKDSIRSDSPGEHETFGVLDPTDTKVTSLKGFGKRVTLRDASGQPLADFLIGNPVKDHPDQRYVRVPGQKRTYGVNVKVDLSTRFADWIETNLLKLEASKVRRVVVDHKTADAANRRFIPGDIVTMHRDGSAAPWLVDGATPAQETNTETATALTSALADLKIVGVRPKPDALTADLKEASGDLKPKSRQDLVSLASKGFYSSSQGLVSTKGEVAVGTDEGVVYTLRYGEVVIAAGDDLSAGTDKLTDAEREAAKKDPLKAKQQTSEGRYLFVTTAFDPTLIPPPKPSTDPDDALPDDPFAYDADEARLTQPSPRAVALLEKQKAETDRKVADGQKRVAELTDRFAGWYYVTPGESYKTILADRANLVRPVGSGKPATPPGGRGGFPGGFPGGMPNISLPGGMGPEG